MTHETGLELLVFPPSSRLWSATFAGATSAPPASPPSSPTSSHPPPPPFRPAAGPPFTNSPCAALASSTPVSSSKTPISASNVSSAPTKLSETLSPSTTTTLILILIIRLKPTKLVHLAIVVPGLYMTIFTLTQFTMSQVRQKVRWIQLMWLRIVTALVLGLGLLRMGLNIRWCRTRRGGRYVGRRGRIWHLGFGIWAESKGASYWLGSSAMIVCTFVIGQGVFTTLRASGTTCFSEGFSRISRGPGFGGLSMMGIGVGLIWIARFVSVKRLGICIPRFVWDGFLGSMMMGSLWSELMFVRTDMSLVPGLIGLCILDGMAKCFYACFGGFFSFLIRVLTALRGFDFERFRGLCSLKF